MSTDNPDVLFEGTVSDLGIIMSGSASPPGSEWAEDRRVRVVAADPAPTDTCICPRFRDTGGYRIADLGCPIHGVNGTDPGDGYWEDDPAADPAPTDPVKVTNLTAEDIASAREGIDAADHIWPVKLPAADPEWEIVTNVTCVVCPDCAFTFDAVHTNTDDDSYSCPLCTDPAPTDANPETINDV